MAGHFLLVNIPLSDLLIAVDKLGGAVSAVQHTHVGWSSGTLDVLRTAASGGNIGNRNQLPPHVYLQINAENPLHGTKKTYLRVASWVDDMTRPASVGLGLRQLCVTAQTFWNLGRKDEAIIAQVEHGAVSVEIYYRSKVPVGAEGEMVVSSKLAL